MERHRLDVESPELAARFRQLAHREQEAVLDELLRAACDDLTPPLALPASAEDLEGLLRRYDHSGTGDDFLRARAAASALYRERGSLDDALYEALHAHRKLDDGLARALRAASA